ncbi:hypothetical protein [Leeuwenhoekiella marinoflava]|uniref:Uncharacterized protein n=2 Tax=Leeuwenhoekiella marinoflava TaxID=988 RepID=A0A4Q0PLG1_9FLAO|nr:hypothetical protein [Leeuwenhoekiella marinoflava]RXG29869.1 hypothetical protein DSL99_1922 [Leeuwenhoekiella marinoflava]SHF27784.1 hypothetical protein SAMN02745246_02115 [Leeuwenhoekiella marinoflava DSM 3653]
MKRIIFILISLGIVSFKLQGQSFNVDKDTLQRTDKTGIYTFSILKAKLPTQDAKNYILELNPDSKSSLNTSDYILSYKPTNLTTLEDKEKISFYLELKEDSIQDRPRNLLLNLTLNDTVKKEKTNTDQLDLHILPFSKVNTQYAYLAYIGTNFDLVDGIKTNNLFFAANVYLDPMPKKTGWYLSLYGNRTFTATDSTQVSGREQRIERINADSILVYRENATLVRTSVSDNLGAHTSFLWNLTNFNSNTKLMVSASTEFIWRRTQVNSLYKDGVPTDTVGMARPIRTSIIQPPNNFTTYSNEFSFNIGPGLFLSHQTNKMSVRLQVSSGYISEYIPRYKTLNSVLERNYHNQSDVYFLGRAWITEATSGITLQAEVTNTLINPRPFFSVTLSKAINFKNLGTIFSPITTR